jgi:hypothetical protein
MNNEKRRSRLAEIVLFWVLAVVPFFALMMMIHKFNRSPWLFISLLLTYAMIYRPILHIFRLSRLKVIEKKDAWKFFIPFYETKYFKDLWLG